MTRTDRTKFLFIGAFLIGPFALLSPVLGQVGPGGPASVIKKAVTEGVVTYRLTEPAEIIALLGKPEIEKEHADGGMIVHEMIYRGLAAVFAKYKGQDSPFTLVEISADGQLLDIGRDRPVVLRNNGDLKKMDHFSGLEGVSLARLDLRSEKEILDRLGFDSRTVWPAADRLPAGFDPGALIRGHQGPGLGVRALHDRGIDGRGVGVAIIDQPLLLGHREYALRILRYDAAGLDGMSPQMHGSPVVSIMVGRTVGVAPRAALTYLAVPMWEQDNRPYIEALRKIVDWNRVLPAGERIRVVSISTGMFPRYPHFAEWETARAEARNAGILVVTCDRNTLKYGILACRPGQDPDDRMSYGPSDYTWPDDAIRVPGAGRTLASHQGEDVYVFDREGGMSWGPPYIAGLAALAFQVAPGISPERLIQLLIESAFTTDAGRIVDPAGFLSAVEREQALKRRT